MTPLQTEAIAHYDRMIEWAKGQNGDDEVDESIMRLNLGEIWYSSNCPYCQKYSFFQSGRSCRDCPLYHDYMCCSGYWGKLKYADTWQEWIISAEAVKQYIIENGA